MVISAQLLLETEISACMKEFHKPCVKTRVVAMIPPRHQIVTTATLRVSMSFSRYCNSGEKRIVVFAVKFVKHYFVM